MPATTWIPGSGAWPAEAARPVVTIGNFDGVHLGHRALVDRSRREGPPVVAFTFDPAPRDVLRPDNGIPRVQRLEDRVARLVEAGVDHVVVEPFDVDYAARGADWFAEEVLGRRLRAAAIVVGWDFRFGRGRSGTAEGLRAWLGVPVHEVDPILLDGEPVSSSRIRDAVRHGDVELAARLLGRPHEVVGAVIHGDARGRTIGFPTANLDVETALVPAPGVYAARVPVDGLIRDAVVNVGVRPTFGATDPRFEVHLLGGGRDLYGETLHAGLVAKIRDERKFDDVQALIAAIHDDVTRAREILAT